jgi:hypothetical protein
MSEDKTDTYLVCTRRKGQPKKHIDVCHKCRWRVSCKPFQEHCQPKLPLDYAPERAAEMPVVPEATPPKPPLAPAVPASSLSNDGIKTLLRDIRRELEAIRRLC